MSTSDAYKTIENSSLVVIFKDRGSKFLGYAFPINSENQVQAIVSKLKEEHHKARHWCYAWQLGVEKKVFRVNDDGEPNNSAGNPIYGQILSNDLTNILVVVVRYFGGTKLGVGGLVNAYRTAASLAIEASQIIKKNLEIHLELQFEYVDMNKVMRLIKEKKLKIVRKEMGMDCVFEISVKKSESEEVINALNNLRCLALKNLN